MQLHGANPVVALEFGAIFIGVQTQQQAERLCQTLKKADQKFESPFVQAMARPYYRLGKPDEGFSHCVMIPPVLVPYFLGHTLDFNASEANPHLENFVQLVARDIRKLQYAYAQDKLKSIKATDGHSGKAYKKYIRYDQQIPRLFTISVESLKRRILIETTNNLVGELFATDKKKNLEAYIDSAIDHFMGQSGGKFEKGSTDFHSKSFFTLPMAMAIAQDAIAEMMKHPDVERILEPRNNIAALTLSTSIDEFKMPRIHNRHDLQQYLVQSVYNELNFPFSVKDELQYRKEISEKIPVDLHQPQTPQLVWRHDFKNPWKEQVSDKVTPIEDKIALTLVAKCGKGADSVDLTLADHETYLAEMPQIALTLGCIRIGFADSDNAKRLHQTLLENGYSDLLLIDNNVILLSAQESVVFLEKALDFNNVNSKDSKLANFVPLALRDLRTLQTKQCMGKLDKVSDKRSREGVPYKKTFIKNQHQFIPADNIYTLLDVQMAAINACGKLDGSWEKGAYDYKGKLPVEKYAKELFSLDSLTLVKRDETTGVKNKITQSIITTKGHIDTPDLLLTKDMAELLLTKIAVHIYKHSESQSNFIVQSVRNLNQERDLNRNTVTLDRKVDQVSRQKAKDNISMAPSLKRQ
ncbi:MAG: hypothetical protein IPP74_04165 [Alphaproteobacteria bacterium]|nr:hypothetical protein [Alphaproteobacteria bacterium]